MHFISSYVITIKEREIEINIYFSLHVITIKEKEAIDLKEKR